MSTFIVAAIVLGSLSFICFMLVYTERKQKRRQRKTLLDELTKLGSENGLALSSQEILNDGVLGLDGVRRKLLLLSRHQNEFTGQVLDLDDIKSCSVKKRFGAINAGELKNSRPEQFLEAIVLCLDFNSGKYPAEIPFYYHIKDHVYQIAEMEQKARHWEMILSKMLKPRVKKTA